MFHDDTSSARRAFLRQSLTLIPVVTLASTGLAGQALAQTAPAVAPAEDAATHYQPKFFSEAQWHFIQAACARLIPADDVGPGAVEAGVPEFLDRHMQTPYAHGAIWYMQGPFVEAPAEFGYQGRLNLRDILRVGIQAVDSHCRQQFAGKVFAQLSAEQQDAVLKAAESGALELEEISSKLFFSNLLAEVRNGFFADPSYGGNKDMQGWKMIGYPGMRADYLDWVTVRDRPYPLPPVDLAGKRG
ncbi:gluconate 2-dehydrogenase subunit 3 family protein [Pseudomonas sp. 5P_3.1_Bac2]|uniref:gluconate 2-dehydrogenase subunit 3 family protein n=1 Tax=Pseudomonas sp. 5P_3.1_Bac2 TaxID=2971617 RepID=UPI0021C9903C|nr:gluconate 2-dehydrogenase subunit 3 family protein [Pseudomonas sp. 5P_3.1_Bac2]MCU1718694.1 gluconate 2-dehydrogenase subunit 3 family protein [Pseudomonas sp. 5P_3.1_Bac2]